MTTRQRVQTGRRDPGSSNDSDADERKKVALEGLRNRKVVKDALGRSSGRAAFEWICMLVAVGYLSYMIDNYQSNELPDPLSAIQAGDKGFAERRAVKHVQALVNFGPHPVGSEALDKAFQYVHSELINIKETANKYVEVEVEIFHAAPGVERLKGGVFVGKTLVYSNLKHIVVRVTPSDFPESKKNAILVSSHIDTVITSPGAGDCSSCISVMLELVRALSHRTNIFKHAIIFLFNTGEEDGLIGAHSFITQHPWTSTLRAAIDVESMGIGGKSLLFQAGPDKWLLDMYKKVARYPSAQIIAQDVFHFGLIKSATDFQVFVEVGGLSGLDFAHVENGAVYHTKNDKVGHLRPGSLQPIGRDLLALLAAASSSDELPYLNTNATGYEQMQTVYFDILGRWMVTYPLRQARRLHLSILSQGLLILFGHIYMSRPGTIVEMGLAILTIVLTWCSSFAHVFVVAIVLPHISPFPIPYIAHPWLVVGIFGIPAIFGALVGHAGGRFLLGNYLTKNLKRNIQDPTKDNNESLVKINVDWHAERWLFKAGMLQWMIVLALGTWIGAGSSYIALFWLLPPAVCYGLMEAQFSPGQNLKGLQRMTFWLSVLVGVGLSAVPVIRLTSVLIGNLARFDRNPGSVPLWTGNALTGGLIAAYVCLMLVYLLPFAHRSGGLRWILLGVASIFLVSMGLVVFQTVPAFTASVGRGLQVVHVVDTKTTDATSGYPAQKISLSAATPGLFEKELVSLKGEDFYCGNSIDFVSHNVKYGCEKHLENDDLLLQGKPTLEIVEDRVSNGGRVTVVRLNSGSARRWNLAINTTAVRGFKLEALGEHQILVPRGDIEGVNGWHNLQFMSDAQGPSDLHLTLFWHPDLREHNKILLLKLRTDVNKVSAELEKVLQQLPEWCVLFGKSTAPYPLTYLAELKA